MYDGYNLTYSKEEVEDFHNVKRLVEMHKHCELTGD